MNMSDIVVDTMMALERAKSYNTTDIVITEGNPKWFHRHHFICQNWDKGKFGKDVVFLDEYLAEFKYHLYCKCGRELIRTTMGLI